jgi:hypothetical protein
MREQIELLKAALQNKRSELARKSFAAHSTDCLRGRARRSGPDTEHLQARGNGHVSEYNSHRSISRISRRTPTLIVTERKTTR